MEPNAMTEQTQSAVQVVNPPRTARPSWIPERLGTHILLWIVCFIVGFPLIYAMLISTQTNAQVASFQLTPGDAFTLNLESIFRRNLGLYMWNTVVLAVIITVGKTIFSLLSGLAFVYFRFPGKWIIFGFVLITLMMPTEILVIALFRLVAIDLQWRGFLALTVPFLASATGTFLFRQHFANIPAELSEAAQLDGATPLQFLWTILIPISWNTIGALAVIQFVYVWNMYLWPLLILREDRMQVVQVGLSSLRSVDTNLTYGPLMLAAVIISIPPVLVFVLLQKQFMSGFAITRDK
jgi:sn-glycerol 3-phosphate transport system permease protein